MYKTGFVVILLCLAFTTLSAQCLSGNCQNGVGKFRFQNGALYEGQMTYSKLNGIGKLRYANGDLYDGHWVMNQRHGKGVIKTHDGYTYEGNFVNNQLQGGWAPPTACPCLLASVQQAP